MKYFKNINYIYTRDEEKEYNKRLRDCYVDEIIYLKYKKDYFTLNMTNKQIILLEDKIYILYYWENQKDYEIFAVIFFDKSDFNKIKEEINKYSFNYLILKRKWISLIE